MKKLLLKKCFFDGWDSLLVLFLNNLVFLFIIAGVFYFDSILMECILLAIASFHFLGVNGMANCIVHGKGKSITAYTEAIKKVGHFVLFYVIALFMVFSVLYIVPVYFSYGDLIWDALGFFLLFIVIVLGLALVYYYPLALQLPNDGPFKTLRKAFMVLGDNLGFSIYCTFKDIFDLTISVITAFLVPGFTGIAINRSTAVYFFMLKYDYMEKEKVSREYAFADRFLEPVYEEYQERNFGTLFVPWKNSKN